MMWMHQTPEWFEAEPNPRNCSVRVLDERGDRCIFNGLESPSVPFPHHDDASLLEQSAEQENARLAEQEEAEQEEQEEEEQRAAEEALTRQ
jgi:hypothetical protein